MLFHNTHRYCLVVVELNSVHESKWSYSGSKKTLHNVNIISSMFVADLCKRFHAGPVNTGVCFMSHEISRTIDRYRRGRPGHNCSWRSVSVQVYLAEIHLTESVLNMTDKLPLCCPQNDSRLPRLEYYLCLRKIRDWRLCSLS